MAQHTHNNDGRTGVDAKRASLLASAQSANRRAQSAGQLNDAGIADGLGSQRADANRRDGARGVADGRGDAARRRGDSWNPSSRTGADRSSSARREGGRHAGGRHAADRSAAGRTSRSKSDTRRAAASGAQPQSLGEFVRRNSVYILSVVAVVAIVAVILMVLRAYLPEQQGQELGGSAAESQEAASPEQFVSAYNWDNLDTTDGRYAYIVDGQVKSKLGIDVSENQFDIDWQAVADDGIDFAMIRLGYRGATEGDLYLDDYYQANLEGAKAAGIACGVYFFSQAQNVDEAVKEAEYVLENLNGVALEYPIAFDSEEAVLGVEETRTTGLDNDAMTAIAEAFCQRVEEAGYRSVVYGNIHDMSRYHYENMQDRDLWWAEYDASFPSAPIHIIMWQYSTAGQVAGVQTDVDMNIDLSGAVE